jgi:hypothetical protein
MYRCCFTILFFLIFILSVAAVQAQAQNEGSWTLNAVNEYRVVPNIVYTTANNYDSKLDVYFRANPTAQCRRSLLFMAEVG